MPVAVGSLGSGLESSDPLSGLTGGGLPGGLTEVLPIAPPISPTPGPTGSSVFPEGSAIDPTLADPVLPTGGTLGTTPGTTPGITGTAIDPTKPAAEPDPLTDALPIDPLTGELVAIAAETTVDPETLLATDADELGDDAHDHDHDHGFGEEFGDDWAGEFPPIAFNAGVFTAKTAEGVAEFLGDGGSYEGQIGLFRVDASLEALSGNIVAFNQEAARRILKGGTDGAILVDDANEGAKFPVKFPGEADRNAGEVAGVKKFSLEVGAKYALMLVPNGTVAQVFANPAVEGKVRPLYSLAGGNPNGTFQMGQLVELGDSETRGQTVIFEDQRMDGGSDRDYNDMIVRLQGLQGYVPSIDSWIDGAKDWRETPSGKFLVDYALPSITVVGPGELSVPEDSLPGAVGVEPSSPAEEVPGSIPVTEEITYPALFDPEPVLDGPEGLSELPPIAIIDTGFAGNNPNLDYSQIIWGKDYVDGDLDPTVLGKEHQHGTHILGLIAALRNSSGVDGLATGAKIWAARAVGSGKWAEALGEYVDYLQSRGFDHGLVNLSFDLTQTDADGKVSTRYEFTPEERRAIEKARQAGVVLVVAAGNQGTGDMSVLAQAAQEFDNIISVAAAEQVDRSVAVAEGAAKTDYSGSGQKLTLTAIGGTLEDRVISLMEDGTGIMAGTSVATAKVSAYAALAWAANPSLNYLQLKEILTQTATDLEAPGYDELTGYGLVNGKAAIGLAQLTEGQPYAPEPWFAPDTWSGEGIVVPGEHAVSMDSDIAAEYRRYGWLLGAIDGPVAPANSSTGMTGFWQEYKNGANSGSIHWTAKYGAVALWIDLHKEYTALGGSNSWLGFPTKSEYDWNGGKRTDFEGGYLFWDGVRAKAYPKPSDALPVNSGEFVRATISNGVTTQYYTNGHLSIQPNGVQSWYSTTPGRTSGGVSLLGSPIATLPFTPPRPLRKSYQGADFNGDGRADFIRQEKGGFATDTFRMLEVYTTKQDGTFFKSQQMDDAAMNGDLTNLFLGDFNGDGRTDFIRQEKGGFATDTFRMLEVYIANSGGTFSKRQQMDDHAMHGDLTNLFLGDFNGDGRTDFLRQEKGGFATDLPRMLEVYTANPEGTFSKRQQMDDAAMNGDLTNLFLGDFNGDGRTDFIRQEKGRFATDLPRMLEVYTANFDGTFSKRQQMDDHAMNGDLTNLFLGDFNGDGRTDFIRQEKGGFATDLPRMLEVYTANPEGTFFKRQQMDDDAMNGDLTNLFLGDFNGDGRTDFLRQEKGRFATDTFRMLEVYTANSDGTFSKRQQMDDHAMHGDLTNLFLGDFNGDGRTDFLRQEKGGFATDLPRMLEVYTAKPDGTFSKSQQIDDAAMNGDLTNLFPGSPSKSTPPPATPNPAPDPAPVLAPVLSYSEFVNGWRSWSEYTGRNPFPGKGANCTWYAHGRMMQLGYSEYALDSMLRNAGEWDNTASRGNVVTGTPKAPSIALWEAGVGGAGSVGHVAVVERVNADGSILISESNWPTGTPYGTRIIRPGTRSWPSKFIHVPK